MSKLMQDAYARRRALEEGEEEAPRRPGPIAGRTTAPRWLVPALVLGATAALYLLFSSLAPATPAETYPTALPGASVPTESWYAPEAEPTAAPAPTSEPLPTAEPAPPVVEEPPPAYVPQAAPAPVYAPPAPTADIFANPSDLVPMAVPADDGLGEREKPSNHPRDQGVQP